MIPVEAIAGATIIQRWLPGVPNWSLGLLLMAAEDLDIDLERSYMVGDMPKDVEAARNVGAKGILVKTGYGSRLAAEEVRPDYLAEDLLDAVNWILKDRQE